MPSDSGAPVPRTSEANGSAVAESAAVRPGRAHLFRQREERKRSDRWGGVGVIAVVIIIVLGVVAVLTAQPYTPGGSSLFPKPGPLIPVTLGAPTSSNVTCGSGATAYVERTEFVSSSLPITTGDVNLRLYEIWDGDNIPDIGVVANVNATSVCAGSPPAAGPSVLEWYVVLLSSNGTILLSYTVAGSWSPVGHGPWNIGLTSGMSLALVTGAPIASTGRGLAVVGFSKGSPIHGSVAL